MNSLLVERRKKAGGTAAASVSSATTISGKKPWAMLFAGMYLRINDGGVCDIVCKRKVVCAGFAQTALFFVL